MTVALFERLKRLLRFSVSAAVLASAIVLLDRPHGLTPALGQFLSPSHGAWAGRSRSPFEKEGVLKVHGLRSKVSVRVDSAGVKHVFAESDSDLYFAQGYITASDRLWQMDFIYRVAAGRVSEVVGQKGLEFDKLFRKFGIPAAAEESAQFMAQDPATREALSRYAEGAEAYIETLTPDSYPMEFKILSYAPEKWGHERAAYFMKFMAFNLAAHSRDLPLTRSQSRVSPEDFEDLFPLAMPTPEPILPKGTRFPFPALAPEPPQRVFRANVGALETLPSPSPGNGSNNWAVSGVKSTTGRPILSNDVHLDYSLPALWYEIQLSSPTQNVYGASLPGAPGVVLGFNHDLAWAVTNGGSDVLDWYELRFRDEKRREYLNEGRWRPAIAEESVIKVKDSEPTRLTLKRTHYGRIVYDESETPAATWIPRGLAMRWAPLEPSNEIKAFLKLNQAHSVEACHRSIASFDWPDQNFLCADSKNIGLWHNGKYPIRWKGQGRTISDGTHSYDDWLGWIPRDQVPGIMNPDRGFLFSANQAPTDSAYPHYLGWPFEEPYRAERISEALRAKEKFAPEEIAAMQGDVEQEFAKQVLPTLLKTLPDTTKLSERQNQMRKFLSEWDFKFGPDSVAASIWDVWWRELEDSIWSEKFPDRDDYAYPPVWRTADLILKDPKSRHFDRLATKKKETLADLALESFDAAEKTLSAKLGADIDRWRWSERQPTAIRHVAHIPGLSREGMAVRGQRFDIYANTGSHGPVWKLVVALGSGVPGEAGAPKAWAIYPGGQSGDPASAHYDDFVDSWARNELRPLHFLQSSDDRLDDSKCIVMEGR